MVQFPFRLVYFILPHVIPNSKSIGYKIALWSSFQTLTNDKTRWRENYSLENGSHELTRHYSNLWKSLIQHFTMALLCVDSLGWWEQQFVTGKATVTRICSFSDIVLSTVLINKYSSTHHFPVLTHLLEKDKE